jgi:hypothetical protein
MFENHELRETEFPSRGLRPEAETLEGDNMTARSTTLLMFLMMLAGSSMMYAACGRSALADETVAATTTPGQQPQDIAQDVFVSLEAGRWIVAIGGMLMLLTWGLRNFGKRYFPWLGTASGGRFLVFLLALLTTLGVAFAANQTPSYGLFAGALVAAWTAAGQWEDIKDTKREAKRRAPTGPMKTVRVDPKVMDEHDAL